MVDHTRHSELLDRYLRNELSADEEAVFETALLDSDELQEALETALALRETIQHDHPAEPYGTGSPEDVLKAHNHWQPFALAASLLLAVFSTTMYWKVSNESMALRHTVDSLNQPYTNLQTVSVEIMRSGGKTPDIIIQKPDHSALLLLEIELSERVQSLDSVHMTLGNEAHSELLAWTSILNGNRTASVAIPSQQLPVGRVWLEFTDSTGTVLDRRLLEFLPEEH